jgi:hypothetical protein
MFDANDWINRLVKAGGRIEIDGIAMRGAQPISAECLAIWNEIRPPVDPESTRWKLVEAEVRRRVGSGGLGWVIYPDDTLS